MHIIQRLSLPEAVPAGIEVWQLKLNLQVPILNSDLLILSEFERTYALHFRTHADQVRSVATRAALRRILASRIMLPPNRLRFDTNRYGKPYLLGDTGIEFNVSHAGQFALIALSTNGQQVGVDIEDCDRQIDINSLSGYVFTAIERRFKLMTTEDFIKRWVAKEAVLKALGLGISEHLQAISVLPGDGESYRLESNYSEWLDVKVWSISVPDSYVAALAAKNHNDAYQGKNEQK